MNTKNIIIILVLLLGISVYFNFQDNQKTDVDFEKKTLCKEVGGKIYQEQISKGNSNRYFNPQYIYNKKLDTCLYYGGYLGDSDSKGFQKWVTDSLTNEDILLYMEVGGEPLTAYCDTCTPSVEEFDRQKTILFETNI